MPEIRFSVVLMLVASLAAVGQITNTIYVPAMGMIANDLTVLPGTVQSVMALYLIAYGISQFIHGPLSDRFGRRPVVLLGLSVFCLGSVLAMLAHKFSYLLFGSFIQGVGIGVGGMMARTAMRDLYTGKMLHTASSYMSIALVVAPLVGPVLGGIFSAGFGWRADFGFLAAFGFIILIFEFFYLPETNRYIGEPQTRLQNTLEKYKVILRNDQFQGYMFCLLVTFGGVSVFEAAAGILFGNVLHYSPTMISLLFIIPLPGYLLGSYLAGYLNKFLGLDHIMMVGILLLACGSFSMLLTGWLGYVNLSAILVPASLYFVGGGLLFPTATAGALDPFGDSAGKAGALLGGLQNLGAGFCTLISAALPHHTQFPLACILTALTILVAYTFFHLIWSARVLQNV